MPALKKPANSKSHPLSLVQLWLDNIEVHNPRIARLFCKIIPAQCPFERKVEIFNRVILDIPPLCHINPLYDQLVGLRFRSLSYLADICGEDITPYCR